MFDLQELQAQCVEGAQRHLIHGLPFMVSLSNHTFEALAQALAHFLGGLVGEGDRGDALGRHAPRRDQVGDFFDDHARLAAASTRQHQQGSVAVLDGRALGRVEGIHEGAHCSGPRRGWQACHYRPTLYPHPSALQQWSASTAGVTSV